MNDAKGRLALEDLSRRERQALDVLYRRGSATVGEIREELPAPPSYSSVRALVGTLEKKGLVTHDQEGPRYIYRPAIPLGTAQRIAARRLIDVFFEGSVPDAIATIREISKPVRRKMRTDSAATIRSTSQGGWDET